MAEHPLPDEELDLIPEQTFPASDAACFMAAAAVVGGPHNVPPSGSRPVFGALFTRRRRAAG